MDVDGPNRTRIFGAVERTCRCGEREVVGGIIGGPPPGPSPLRMQSRPPPTGVPPGYNGRSCAKCGRDLWVDEVARVGRCHCCGLVFAAYPAPDGSGLMLGSHGEPSPARMGREIADAVLRKAARDAGAPEVAEEFIRKLRAREQAAIPPGPRLIRTKE